MQTIKELIIKRLREELTPAEEQQLQSWVGLSVHNRAVFEEINDRHRLAESFTKLDNLRTEEAWEKIRNYTPEDVTAMTPVHRVHFLKTAWFKYAAAIILIFTGFAVYYLIDAPQPKTQVVQNTPPAVPSPDVLAGTDRAVLTLSDGTKVELNNAASETIKDGDLTIGNENGRLVYGGGNPPAPNGATPFSKGGVAVSQPLNTMTTPKGGQYKLTLSDGTKVWLNAASSITYPIAFTAKTREVSVTGEAYFEVTKNKEKPFIVTVASSYPPLAEVAAKRPEVDRERSERTTTYRIEVLGTSFNVNSYPDEMPKTSLLEGSIKINNNILKPNQAFTNGKVTATNIAQDIAWKNGVFNFTNLTVDQMMRQLARWYDVEISYPKGIPHAKFGGEIGRNLNLNEVIAALKDVGINCRLEGKKLIVTN